MHCSLVHCGCLQRWIKQLVAFRTFIAVVMSTSESCASYANVTARAYSARVCRSKGLHGRKLVLCFYSTCAEKNQWLYLLLQRRLRIFQFQDCHRWGKQSWILVRQVDRFVVTLSKQRDLSELQENLVKHTTEKRRNGLTRKGKSKKLPMEAKIN